METIAGIEKSDNDTIPQVIQVYIPLAVEVCGILGSSFLLSVLILHGKSTRIPITLKIAMCYLLVTDVLYLILAVSDDVIYDFKGAQMSDFNEVACYGVTVLIFTLVPLQCYTQCIISVERVLAIAVPLKVKFLVTRRRMISALVFVTVIMLALGIVSACFAFHYHERVCNLRGKYEKTYYFLQIFSGLEVFLIPTSVLFLCTCCIIALLIRRRILVHPSIMSERRLPNMQIRLCIMLLVMDILFIATFLPYYIDLYHHFIEVEVAQQHNVTLLHRYHRLPLKLTRLAASTDWLVLLGLGSEIRQSAMRITYICAYQQRRTKRDAAHFLVLQQ